MIRVIFCLLLVLPLVVPAGFCPCHVDAAETACDVDHESADVPVDHDERDCPCQSVDYGIRGFLGHGGVALEGPAASSAMVDAGWMSSATFAQTQDRDAASLFPSPPRFVLYSILLI